MDRNDLKKIPSPSILLEIKNKTTTCLFEIWNLLSSQLVKDLDPPSDRWGKILYFSCSKGWLEKIVLNMKKKSIFKGLAEEEIAYYYTLLNEEITNFNCGTLCAPQNGGEPFCCKVENAVPFLYKEEFTYLKKQSDLWSIWKPKTKHEIKLKKNTETEDTIFCECKGVSFCERENRSISCRTFPLEPYIDKRDVMVGLVFMNEFSEGCPLTNRPKDIRQEFIDSHFLFWEKLLLRKDDEYETYQKSSRRYRLSREKSGKDFVIFYPSHLQGKDYIFKYV